MPADTPVINAYECQLAGARTFLVDGLITDCGRLMRSGTVQMGWFDVSTLREPYRIEGKKTMGLELAEQSDWRLPDVVLYPTGGGTGLIGMWKAFAELAELGWLESTNRPRMVAVQSDGCAPIVRAFEQNARFAEPFPDAHTIASGLRVPAAVGDFMILDAVRESHGTAIAVDESRLIDWMRLANQSEGISVCPEAAACVGAAQHLARSGFIRPADRVVLFNTAAAQKYPEAISAPIPRLSKDQPIDWNALEKMDRRH
jgi:threonine synthase